MDAVDPAKDVDGLHPVSAGLLALGRPRLVARRHSESCDCSRSTRRPERKAGGRRRALQHRRQACCAALAPGNATVTICHSRTADLARETLEADILVAATGVLHLISARDGQDGLDRVDVGMNRTDEGLFGDVEPEAMESAAYMTPVPGGVGPMTIAMLLQNAVRAARLRRASGCC